MRARERHLRLVGLALAIIAVACGPVTTGASPSPTAPGQAPGTLVAAAQKEGVVFVSGPKGLSAFQKAITAGFTSTYHVPVDYSSLGSKGVLSSMKAVGPKGTAPWDVLVGGNDTLMFPLKKAGLLAPLAPELVLPDATDTSTWSGGALPWIDSGHTGVAFLQQAGQYFYIDTSKVDPASITTYQDLLDPKLKGRILLTNDPRSGGHARALFAFFLGAPGLGKSFVEDLLMKQDPIIAKSSSDADRLLKQGHFSICICNNAEGTALLASGARYVKLDPHKVKEGSDVTSSFANVTMPTHPPHPNAAKLYVNWLLTRAAQSAASQASKIASMRTDVSREGIPAASIPDPSWPSGSNEAAIARESAATKLVTQILGPLKGG